MKRKNSVHNFFLTAFLLGLGMSARGVWAAAPVITSTGSIVSAVGSALNFPVTATNSPTSFAVTGTLPAGITLNTQTGNISGISTTVGTVTVTIQASNASGTGTASLRIAITPLKPAITSAGSVAGKTGSAFSYQITGTNNPTSFSSGALPAGLSLNSQTGAITGMPTLIGSATVTIGANNAGGTGTATLQITIQSPVPVVTSPGTLSGPVRSAFSYQIAATNNPMSFGMTGTLPAGLSFNAQTGLISGTPGTVGTTNVTISATNAGGTGTMALQIIVHAPAGSKLINVQGKITDTSGNPLTSSVIVVFRFYANLADPIGNAVWTESQLVAPQNGLFNITLGNATALDTVPFNKPYYLGMQVSGDNNELQPRQLLGASAYALGSLGDFNVQGNIATGGAVSANSMTANTLAVNTSVSINGQDVKSYLVPAGAIMMFAGGCPQNGWVRFAAMDNLFPMGAATYGATDPAPQHSHTISPDGAHNHTTQAQGLNSATTGNGPTCMATINCPSWVPYYPGQTTSLAPNHSHGGATGPAVAIPPYLAMVYCVKQ